MCQPDSYLTACRQVAHHLVALDLLTRTNADTRLHAIAARLDALARDAADRVAQAGFAGSPVIASEHQRDFCAWLGLKVAAAFRAADTASIGEIEDLAVHAGQRCLLEVAHLRADAGSVVALMGPNGAGSGTCRNCCPPAANFH